MAIGTNGTYGVRLALCASESLLEYLRSADQGIQRERQERLDDVALITELITAGWRSVDRRLGRVERLLKESVISDGKREQATRYLYFDSPQDSPANLS
jgi:hypothetical protein